MFSGQIKPAVLSHKIPVISAGELRAIPFVLLGDNMVGLKLGDTRFNTLDQFIEAVSYHGFYGKKSKTGGEPLVVIDLNNGRHQLSLEALKNAHEAYLGGAGEYGFGPTQNSLALDVARACEAQRSLKQGSVSTEEAQVLLDWITQKTRNALAKSQGHNAPNEYSGACGYAQGIVGHQCESIGIDVKYHQVKNLSLNSLMLHAFNVVTIPVRDDFSGKVEDKHYLVDTTFKQFFNCTFEGVNADSIMKSWGARLTETQEGREFADTLLKNGFVELDDEKARLYVEAQVAIHNSETKYYDEVKWEIKSALDKLVSQSTTSNGYFLEELQNLDISSPEMMVRIHGNIRGPSLPNPL